MGNDNITIPVRMNIFLRFQGGMPQAKPQYVSLAQKCVSVAFARHPDLDPAARRFLYGFR